jgi:hypothetical protein
MTEPKSYAQAMKSPDSEQWQKAMQVEYNSLLKNHVFTLVPRPENRSVIAAKWVYKVKRHPDGTVERFKARLVARGDTQTPGEDYDETYAPVAKFCSIRCFLVTAFQYCLTIYHLDIETAYLNATLDDEIYMEQPPGFKPDNALVCRLLKCLYGLKQAGRRWHEEFRGTLLHMGWLQAKSDGCLFTYQKNQLRMQLCLYVDDILLAVPSAQNLAKFEADLSKKYVVKNLGELHWYLGMEILRDGHEMLLSQRVYTEKILERFGMKDSKPAKTPMDSKGTSCRDATADAALTQPLPPTEPFREVVGCLMYLMVATRPDIAYAVGVLSRQVSNPTQRSWTQAKRVLKYLLYTKHLGLRITRCRTPDFTPSAYVDADWGRDSDTARSTTGCVLFLGNAPIIWASRMQKCVALSSTESEYIALSECVKEVLWVSRLLADLGLNCPKISIFEDNAGCIKLAKNPVFHKRTKHINIRYHFVREHVSDGSIELTWVPTSEMIADALTKPLAQPAFEDKRRRLLNMM